MSQPVIKVENLSKRYRIGLKERNQDTFLGQIGSLLRAPIDNFRQLRSLSHFNRDDESVFWALRDINFEVKEGEVLGIIGHNGAGKSTLLKILSRITEPTDGRIIVKGRIGAMLEVGTGFHPELTGRDNIYMNGTILGMARKEIDRKLDEIVDFSGVEKYIDTPVKFYSSGMKVRLGFAVAAHLEPEILVIDEVLAVGDVEFQKKCIGKMKDVAGEGRTVLFVSHDMAAISNLCNRAVLLNNGFISYEGVVEDTIREYLINEANSQGIRKEIVFTDQGVGEHHLEFIAFWIENENLGKGLQFDSSVTKFIFQYKNVSDCKIRNVSISVVLYDVLGKRLLTLWNELTAQNFENIPSEGEFECQFSDLPLASGIYYIRLWCSVNGTLSNLIENVGTASKIQEDIFGTGKMPQANKHGHIIVKNQYWSIK